MGNTTNINLRVSAELKRMIEEAAQAERRTVTNYLLNLACEDIERKKVAKNLKKIPEMY